MVVESDRGEVIPRLLETGRGMNRVRGSKVEWWRDALSALPIGFDGAFGCAPRARRHTGKPIASRPLPFALNCIIPRRHEKERVRAKSALERCHVGGGGSAMSGPTTVTRRQCGRLGARWLWLALRRPVRPPDGEPCQSFRICSSHRRDRLVMRPRFLPLPATTPQATLGCEDPEKTKMCPGR